MVGGKYVARHISGIGTDGPMLVVGGSGLEVSLTHFAQNMVVDHRVRQRTAEVGILRV